MSEEKRRDRRFETKRKLWCEGQTDMETRDISRSGMFIMAGDAPDVGQHLKVAFEGDEGTIEFDAEVMWRGGKGDGDKIGMGVRIVSFSQGEDAYERIIKEHLGEEPEASGEKPPEGGDT